LFVFRKEATIVPYIPKKYKNFVLISSLHFGDTIDRETGDQLKPEIVTFCNGTRSGVDIVDHVFNLRGTIFETMANGDILCHAQH
jgi:hypothetical protein